MGRNKDKEREVARIMYTKQGLDARTIAGRLNLNIKTVYRWIKQYNWQALRSAELTKPTQRLENIRQIIFDLAEQRLAISNQIKEAEKKADKDTIAQLRKDLAQIDNAASYWNKVLAQIDKESKVSLAQYLLIMEEIFEALRQYDPKIFIQTIEFQEYYLQKLTARYEKH